MADKKKRVPDPKRTIPPKKPTLPGREACPVCGDSGFVMKPDGLVPCPLMPHPTGR